MLPEIRLSESIVLPTYLLYLSLLYCFLIFYTVRRAEKLHQSVKTALDLGLLLMVGGFVGGRLLHVLYEMPKYYLENPWRILQFWEGGFVFFGGFAVALAACVVYVLKKKISFLRWADFYSPVIALGYGLGRGSCFLAGCCYGRFCTLPWATTFPWDLQQIPRHPTQLYAVVWELVAFGILISVEKIRPHHQGLTFSLWLIMHGLGRMMMEYYRDDFRGEPMMGLSLSLWISGVITLAGIAVLSRSLSSKTPNLFQK